jgi:hypothetical protein
MFSFIRTRALMVIIVSALGLLLPQAVPLEYHLLNNPSVGLQYLEITRASSVPSTVQSFLGTGRGFNELDKILFPIGPRERPYTFPLLDAPIFDPKINPFERRSGELTIANLRIINRKGSEIKRFGAEDFTSLNQLAIKSLGPAWKLVTSSSSDDPYALLHLGRTIVAEGMNERNALRCLISTGYLAVMLWILLLAIYFTFWNQQPLQTAVTEIGFIAAIAVLFSVDGNRSLIKNSASYAYNTLFVPHAQPAENFFAANATAGLIFLEIACASNVSGLAEFFMDSGRGFSELEKLNIPLEPSEVPRTYTLTLPDRPLLGLRVDPLTCGPGELRISSFRVLNRRIENVRQFNAVDFQTTSPLDSIKSHPSGWSLVAAETSSDAGFQVKFGPPLIPAGMDRRDLMRQITAKKSPSC